MAIIPYPRLCDCNLQIIYSVEPEGIYRKEAYGIWRAGTGGLKVGPLKLSAQDRTPGALIDRLLPHSN